MRSPMRRRKLRPCKRRHPKSARPVIRALEARKRGYFEEGRAGARLGIECPYVLPSTRREWLAGYRDELIRMNQYGPASSAGEGR